MVAGLMLGSSSASAATVVSLTLDHGRVEQHALRSVLSAHNVKATFFVSSGLVGSAPRYMTWDQLHELYADGHEIGGHTVTHADPSTLTPEQQSAEVCDDRANLLNQGFAVSSFSYPFGSTAISQAIVQGCGYNSGRGFKGLRSDECSTCPVAEEIPPANVYRTRSSDVIRSTSAGLETARDYIRRAEQNGGGWVQLVFPYNCDVCMVTPQQMDSFLAWLVPRAASEGTIIRTVQQVIRGELQPAPFGTEVPVVPTPPQDSGLQPSSGRDTNAPVIARLGISRRTFAIARDLTPVFAQGATRRRAKRGTEIRYIVSEPGTVNLRIDRLLPGRRSGGTCQRPTRRLRGARPCTRRQTVGRLTRVVTTLANRTRFSGRIGNRRLRPGQYRILATEMDAAGNVSAAKQVRFRVVRR